MTLTSRSDGIPQSSSLGRSLWDRDPRPVLAFDWGAHQIHVTRDGNKVDRHPTVLEAISKLTEPHKLVAESTFESYSAERRVRFVEAIRAAGHELYVFRPLRTARRRKAVGEKKKSHEVDVRTIWELAVDLPHHVYPIVLTPSVRWVARRQQVNLDYHVVRVTPGAKKALLADAVALLGPFKEQSLTTRLVLGAASQKNYAESLLAAAMFAAHHARNRDEFEKLLGLSGSAYPSLLRSDVHHHHVRHLRKRNPELPSGERLMTVLRRELRRVYAAVKASRASAPPAA